MEGLQSPLNSHCVVKNLSSPLVSMPVLHWPPHWEGSKIRGEVNLGVPGHTHSSSAIHWLEHTPGTWERGADWLLESYAGLKTRDVEEGVEASCPTFRV